MFYIRSEHHIHNRSNQHKDKRDMYVQTFQHINGDSKALFMLRNILLKIGVNKANDLLVIVDWREPPIITTIFQWSYHLQNMINFNRVL